MNIPMIFLKTLRFYLNFSMFFHEKKVSPPGRIGLRRRHGFGRILLNHLLHHLVALENHGKTMETP